MPDDVDVTTEREEKMMALLRRRVPVNELEPTGGCHWCGEPVEHPKKFCDQLCAEDFENHKRMQRLNR